MMRRIIVFMVALALMSAAAEAQTLNLRDLIPDGQASTSGRIIQLMGLLTILAVAPGILVTMTCFTRFIIALSFLRSGLGLPTTPPNIVLVSLALFMTAFVMAPTLDRIWSEGIQPLVENKIDEKEAYQRIVKPVREFMLSNVRDRDIQLFSDLAGRWSRGGPPQAQDADAIDLRILVPAFMISELRRGFEIGFLIVLPFLAIDLIVATIVMSMGMMMLPPTVVSLPFKVLFFVLIDGWNILAGSLVRSFA